MPLVRLARAWYLQIEIACGSGCENNREFARAQLYGVTVRVEDTGNPGVWLNNGGGNVFGPYGAYDQRWIRGTRSRCTSTTARGR
jgi:hypothetical protein